MRSGLTQAPPRHVPAHRRPREPRRWAWWLVTAVAALVLLVATTMVIVYARLTGNVRHIDVTGADLGAARPAKMASTALNVLIVGSDRRDGGNSRYGRLAGERTDTIMLAHLSSGRDNAMVVSFPRDSLVRLPACQARDGLPGQQPHLGMINESFNSGGIACTWKTVETLTGIRIDHFVKVDFSGFTSMVDAVGGVEVCLPEPVHDAKALLHLPAGRQTLNGEQALGYVRARYSFGDGSDIGRIQRQQMFIASMVKKVMSGETLTDPARLLGFLDAGTKAVTTDPALTPGVMKDLALSLRGLNAGRIRFITTPWHYSLTHPGRVEWVQPQADRLFELVARDRDPGEVEGGQTTVPRSQVQVELRNGTYQAGLGTQVAALLEQRGYHVTKVGDTTRKPYAKTLVYYSPNGEARVPTLTKDLVAATPAAVPQAATSRLVLVLGDDWAGLKPLRTGDTEAVKGFDATHDTCATS
ncbi:LCP family protein [Nonomuraea muscovyensis]|uniref:LCP family protein required for cell wall assembly n=1 Tax=Nonomuraea muscovyensis TaxID=1124761 RepID=A0A7X0BZY0_9ACTN|nr:LCP family protein [Nonomuraea muscovyensis]MBB6345942.1 LCP family protein required for cell wall assembly [Nonomuraea muscovyensis]